MKISVPKSLIELIKNADEPMYVVGGYVRNRLAGLPPSDIDIAGPAVPAILQLEPKYRMKVVNFRLGTAIIRCGKEVFEYTPFRVESYNNGSHTPSEVLFTNDIRTDAIRRDFTCNSIYYDPLTDEIYDFYGGQEDIEKKIIRAAKPERVFASDGLRILRLVRLASELGFKIESETAKAAMAKAEYLKDISPERITVELKKMLVADTKYGIEDAHFRAMKLLHKMGLWKYIIPEVAECEGVDQNSSYHKYDVLEHTFRAVRYAPPKVRLAALMHDLGKPYCIRQHGNMHGHEKASENITRFRLGQNGLKFSNTEIEETARLVGNHMFDFNSQTKESKVKLFIAKNYDIIDRLVDLIEADTKASGLAPEKTDEHRFSKVKWRMIEEEAPIFLEDLAVSGEDLVEAGFTGRRISEILEELHKECILNPTLNNVEWLNKRIAILAERELGK